MLSCAENQRKRVLKFSLKRRNVKSSTVEESEEPSELMLFVMNSLSSLVPCRNYAICFCANNATNCLSVVRNVCAAFMCHISMSPCHRLLDVAVMPAQGFAFFCPCQLSWALPQQSGERGSCLHPFMAMGDLRAGCTCWCLLSHQPFQPSSTSTQCHSSEWAFCTSGYKGYNPFQKPQHFLPGSRARAEQPRWCH